MNECTRKLSCLVVLMIATSVPAAAAPSIQEATRHHVTHPQLIRFVEGEAPAVLGGGLVGFLAHKVMATKQAMHRGGSKVYRFGNRTAFAELVR